MPPYNTQAPAERPEHPSPISSIIEDFISSDSPTPSDIDVFSCSASSDSELGDSYTLTAPGYEKIKIPLEQNLKQLLIKATDTDDLESVTSIRLQVIAREFSLQRLPTHIPHLQELNLDGSCLLSLRDLGCDLHTLRILRVNRCGLNSLDGLFGLQTLVELYAGHNQIRDLSPCAVLPDIETLDLRKNCIEDISSVTFLSLCTTLRNITLEECPTADIENYRQTIKSILPDLKSLDGIPFKKEDFPNSKNEETDKTKIISRFPPIKKSEALKSKPQTKLPIIKRPHTTDCVPKSNKGIKLLPIRPATARRAGTDEFSYIVDGSDFKLKNFRAMSSATVIGDGKTAVTRERVALIAWNDCLDSDIK